MAKLKRPGTRLVRTSWQAAFLLFLLPAICLSETRGAPRVKVTFRPSGVAVMAEKADSPERRAAGLMRRTTLGEKEGMLFYFAETSYHSFWMYNTPLPLTILFLDDRYTVVDIQDMEPCVDKSPDQCPSYTTKFPARYALEVKKGFAARHRIEVGHRADVKEIVPDGASRRKAPAGRRQ